jgi:hypothetical protein
MATYIQPSSDPRATAIAVAWAIADRTTVSDGGTTSEQECKDLAGLVAELSRAILSAANSKGLGLDPLPMAAK